MNAAFVLLIGSCVTDGLGAGFVKLFEVQSVSVTAGEFTGRSIPYRLFVPRRDKMSEPCPLIVWFHGYQERGDDLVQHLRWLDQLVITNATEPERYQFFLLAIQLPETETGWYKDYMKPNGSVSDLEVGMLAIVMQAINDVCKHFPIDSDRITACGVSLGGSACWEFGVRYSDKLAGIAPIASPGALVDSMINLKDVPTWVFNCTNDPSSSLASVRKRVDAINGAGGRAILTEVDSSEHDAWTAAFQEYALLDWLLAQNRSRQFSTLGIIVGIYVMPLTLIIIGLLAAVAIQRVKLTTWRKK